MKTKSSRFKLDEFIPTFEVNCSDKSREDVAKLIYAKKKEKNIAFKAGETTSI